MKPHEERVRLNQVVLRRAKVSGLLVARLRLILAMRVRHESTPSQVVQVIGQTRIPEVVAVLVRVLRDVPEPCPPAAVVLPLEGDDLRLARVDTGLEDLVAIGVELKD